jgi:hypothetical protein
MNETMWEDEVVEVARAAWVLFLVKIDPATTTCTAHLVNRRTRRSRFVALSYDTFNSRELRQAEIRRQLDIKPEPTSSRW